MKNKKYSEFSKDELIKELNKITSRKKFGLNWEDQFEECVDRLNFKLPFLEEVKKTKEVARRLERVMVFIFGGLSFLTTNYAYLRLRSQEATRIARNSY